MRRALLAFPAALLLLTPAFANAADPPGRVGRLSYIDGTVSFHPADQGDWSPATVNYPVTNGESFWTDANARAEFQVGPAELRLDQASQLDISQLDNRATDVQLDQGVLNLHLWQMPQGEVKVRTPRGQVVITAPGSYNIDAGQPNGNQPSDQIEVSVLAGAARFDGDRGAVDIPAGQAAQISGNPADVQLVAADPTDFDQWAQSREQHETAAQQPRYVPAAVTGYQDLDQYGSWSPDPDYGQVWYPSDVPAGWAPYRYGHWAWVAPWGWTWIDDSPWGFAPFHYGRWIDRDDRWAWVPQDIPPQPVYAPALVSFVGGDGWGVDLAAGAAVAAIGWVALAPHEEYHPDFRASETWARGANGRDWNAASYNARNQTIDNFRNRQAATVVPAAAFAGAAPVQRATVAVAPDQLAHTRTTTAPTTLRPSANARIGRADPAVAAAVVSQPNAPARVAQGRVAAPATPPNVAAEKPPTAPAPHPVAAADTRQHRNANAPAAATKQNQPNQATPPRAQNQTAPNQPPAANQAPQRAQNQPPANQPAANQPPREAQHAAPNAPPNANLAPHPAPPPNAAAAAPNARPEAPRPGQPPRPEQATGPTAPQHPAAPQTAARPPEPAHPAPPVAQAPAPPSPAHPAAPQTAARPPEPAHPAPPSVAHVPPAPPPARPAAPAPPSVAHAPPAPHPATPPPPQVAHAPPAAAPPPRPAAPPPVAHAAPPPAPHPAAPPPQVARAPAPPPPRPAAPPPAAHPAAPPAAPHPAAAPAPAPHPAPAPPHPAAPAKAPPPTPDKKPPPQ
jgi:hypothetical protein